MTTETKIARSGRTWISRGGWRGSYRKSSRRRVKIENAAKLVTPTPSAWRRLELHYDRILQPSRSRGGFHTFGGFLTVTSKSSRRFRSHPSDDPRPGTSESQLWGEALLRRFLLPDSWLELPPSNKLPTANHAAASIGEAWPMAEAIRSSLFHCSAEHP